MISNLAIRLLSVLYQCYIMSKSFKNLFLKLPDYINTNIFPAMCYTAIQYCKYSAFFFFFFFFFSLQVVNKHILEE